MESGRRPVARGMNVNDGWCCLNGEKKERNIDREGSTRTGLMYSHGEGEGLAVGQDRTACIMAGSNIWGERPRERDREIDSGGMSVDNGST